jgi:acetyl esterase/lipase
MVVLGESAGSNLAAAVLIHDEARVARSGVLLYGLYEFASAASIMSQLGLPTTYVAPDRVSDFAGDSRLNPILLADRLLDATRPWPDGAQPGRNG